MIITMTLQPEYVKLDTIGHMGHVRLYTEVEVKGIVGHMGFQIVHIGSGGKLSGKREGIIASLLSFLVPSKMKVQLYVWAEKPA